MTWLTLGQSQVIVRLGNLAPIAFVAIALIVLAGFPHLTVSAATTSAKDSAGNRAVRRHNLPVADASEVQICLGVAKLELLANAHLATFEVQARRVSPLENRATFAVVAADKSQRRELQLVHCRADPNALHFDGCWLSKRELCVHCTDQ